MMQNFGLEDLSHVQSRRNLLKYLVRVEMASDWFTRIYRSILAEQISSKIGLGCGLFLSPQLAPTLHLIYYAMFETLFFIRFGCFSNDIALKGLFLHHCVGAHNLSQISTYSQAFYHELPSLIGNATR